MANPGFPQTPDPGAVTGAQVPHRIALAEWLRSLLPAALLITCLALYNRSPLTYFDTGAYLLHARALAHGYLPDLFERPLTYGLLLAPFLKLASPLSLFGIPVLQGLLVAFVVTLVLRVAGASLSARGFLALFAALTAFTSLPWFSDQLMPDIFTSLVILLAFVVIWGGEELTRVQLWVAPGLLAFAIAAHLSHFPLYGALLLAGLTARAAAGGRPVAWRRLIPLAARGCAPLLVAAGLVMAPNWYLYRTPVLSRGASLFTLAHLVGDGAAQRYLRRACPTRPYLLCWGRANLRADSDWFLWSATGPWQQYQLGGEPWYSTFLRQTPAIVSGTLHQEWRAEIRASVRHAGAQLMTFGTEPAMESARNAFVVARELRRVFPAALPAFETSRQVERTLPMKFTDTVERVAVALSLLVLLVCLPALRGPAHRRLRMLIATVGTGVLVNALVIGSLGSVLNRYQGRVMWLLPLVGIIVAARVVEARTQRGGSRIAGAPA
jgi:hypothetical protein